MKIIGFIFLTIGLTLLLFLAYTYFKEGDHIRSPIPEEKGVKVIFVTPTPAQ
jgi:hypothetical protein